MVAWTQTLPTPAVTGAAGHVDAHNKIRSVLDELRTYLDNLPAGGGSFSGSYTDLTNKPVFAAVATSGSYTDLSNKPTIPAAPTWSTLSGKPAVIAAGADAASARTAIGAGTSSLALGTTGTTALAGNTRLDQLAGPTADIDMNGQSFTDLRDPVGSQDPATKAYVDANSGSGITSLTYANAAPGTRFTLLYNGSTGFVDPASGSVAAARPSARTDIYFDLIGGSASVADPAWMINGDVREITS